MDFCEAYIIPTEGPLFDLVTKTRKQYNATHRAILKFVNSVGGTGYKTTRGGCLGGAKIQSIQFKDEPTRGKWKKADKEGCRQPYKSDMKTMEEFNSYTYPDMYKIVADFTGAPDSISYETAKGSHGSTGIGHPWNAFAMYWFDPDGPILVQFPDVAASKAKLLEERFIPEDNDVTICKEADWVPDLSWGKVTIIEEWNLLQARHKLEKENGSK